ncbi:MAG: SurA N-terminal domain-containing protein [Paracoccaceae bacterium]
MAKTTETPRKKKKPGEIAVWLLMAFVILGLGGFGVHNFGGGSSAVATVGGKKITANDYARQLQQQLNKLSQQFGQNITLEQARAFGIDRQVLSGLIDLSAQDAEADKVGLSVGDGVVASALQKIPAFQGPTGGFSRETYAFTLRQNKLTEPRFEQQLRDDMSRQLLVGAVKGGFQAPAALTDTLYAWMGERRAVSVLRLGEADLAAPIAAPTDDELKAWYDAHVADYTRPAAKKVAYAVLTPADVQDKVTVDEAAVKALYDQRADQYQVPEKRLVERLVFPDQAAADAAKAKLDAGTSFEDLVRERGLSLQDTDMGDVAKADLGAAGEAVFALTEPGVAGPVMSDLGPALFRVNAILDAQTTPFDQVKDELTAELRTDAARKEIEGKVEAIDDALAGGATLADLAREQGMRSGSFDYAPGADDNDPIAASQAFRTAADAAQEGDFPEAVTLEDGGVAAIEVQGAVPPTPLAFDKVRDKVAAAWKADALSRALDARAAEIRTAVEGGQRLETFGIVDVTPQLPREGTLQGAPEGAMKTVFEMKEGEIRAIEGPGFTALVRVDRVIPAAPEGPDADALRASIKAQIDQGLSDDAMQLWTGALANDAGITIDQQAIDAVNAQFN